MKKNVFIVCMLLLSTAYISSAQMVQEDENIASLSNDMLKVTVNKETGNISYSFSSGTLFENTYAYMEDVNFGNVTSTDFKKHNISFDNIKDRLGGKGICINIAHENDQVPFSLVQHITIYENQPFILISAEADAKDVSKFIPVTRNISPFALTTSRAGNFKMKGDERRFTDFPFDNDDWADVVTRPFNKGKISGISQELAAMFDKKTMAGFVTGSLIHNCWKTGIHYASGKTIGSLDTLIVYGGAATPDIPSLPSELGGLAGTHDVMPHGIVSDAVVQSPLIYLSATEDVRNCYVRYGKGNAIIAGTKKWNGNAPGYWNSFGVEGVLGNQKIMMPSGVLKISDFIQSMKNFNACSPTLSIDAFNQEIYTPNMLASIEKYAAKRGQKISMTLKYQVLIIP